MSWRPYKNIPRTFSYYDMFRELKKYDSEFADRFFTEHLAFEINDKSTFRSFFQSGSSLWRQLTIEFVTNSILTSKEWLLMYSRCKQKMPDEVYTHLHTDLTCEILSAKSKMTKPLSKALKKVKERHG